MFFSFSLCKARPFVASDSSIGSNLKTVRVELRYRNVDLRTFRRPGVVLSSEGSLCDHQSQSSRFRISETLKNLLHVQSAFVKWFVRPL